MILLRHFWWIYFFFVTSFFLLFLLTLGIPISYVADRQSWSLMLEWKRWNPMRYTDKYKFPSLWQNALTVGSLVSAALTCWTCLLRTNNVLQSPQVVFCLSWGKVHCKLATWKLIPRDHKLKVGPCTLRTSNYTSTCTVCPTSKPCIFK